MGSEYTNTQYNLRRHVVDIQQQPQQLLQSVPWWGDQKLQLPLKQQQQAQACENILHNISDESFHSTHSHQIINDGISDVENQRQLTEHLQSSFETNVFQLQGKNNDRRLTPPSMAPPQYINPQQAAALMQSYDNNSSYRSGSSEDKQYVCDKCGEIPLNYIALQCGDNYCLGCLATAVNLRQQHEATTAAAVNSSRTTVEYTDVFVMCEICGNETLLDAASLQAIQVHSAENRKEEQEHEEQNISHTASPQFAFDESAMPQQSTIIKRQQPQPSQHSASVTAFDASSKENSKTFHTDSCSGYLEEQEQQQQHQTHETDEASELNPHCKQHPNEEGAYFCWTCECQCVCRFCVGEGGVGGVSSSGLHAGHRVSRVQGRCEDLQSTLEVTFLEIKRKASSMKVQEEELETSKQTVESESALRLEELRVVCRSAKEAIDEHERHIHTQISNAKANRVDVIENTKDKLGEARKTLLTLSGKLAVIQQPQCFRTVDAVESTIAYNYFAECKRILNEILAKNIVEDTFNRHNLIEEKEAFAHQQSFLKKTNGFIRTLLCDQKQNESSPLTTTTQIQHHQPKSLSVPSKPVASAAAETEYSSNGTLNPLKSGTNDSLNALKPSYYSGSSTNASDYHRHHHYQPSGLAAAASEQQRYSLSSPKVVKDINAGSSSPSGSGGGTASRRNYQSNGSGKKNTGSYLNGIPTATRATHQSRGGEAPPHQQSYMTHLLTNPTCNSLMLLDNSNPWTLSSGQGENLIESSSAIISKKDNNQATAAATTTCGFARDLIAAFKKVQSRQTTNTTTGGNNSKSFGEEKEGIGASVVKPAVSTGIVKGSVQQSVVTASGGGGGGGAVTVPTISLTTSSSSSIIQNLKKLNLQPQQLRQLFNKTTAATTTSPPLRLQQLKPGSTSKEYNQTIMSSGKQGGGGAQQASLPYAGVESTTSMFIQSSGKGSTAAAAMSSGLKNFSLSGSGHGQGGSSQQSNLHGLYSNSQKTFSSPSRALQLMREQRLSHQIRLSDDFKVSAFHLATEPSADRHSISSSSSMLLAASASNSSASKFNLKASLQGSSSRGKITSSSDAVISELCAFQQAIKSSSIFEKELRKKEAEWGRQSIARSPQTNHSVTTAGGQRSSSPPSSSEKKQQQMKGCSVIGGFRQETPKSKQQQQVVVVTSLQQQLKAQYRSHLSNQRATTNVNLSKYPTATATAATINQSASLSSIPYDLYNLQAVAQSVSSSTRAHYFSHLIPSTVVSYASAASKPRASTPTACPTSPLGGGGTSQQSYLTKPFMEQPGSRQPHFLALPKKSNQQESTRRLPKPKSFTSRNLMTLFDKQPTNEFYFNSCAEEEEEEE